ncbi:hypothetical protein MLD38_000205 [Melastoma candidum]|uniref:Uncharacterized protein n=1 Tax=Melastoma candidum TaxID=119954 RepID=A0ACB9SAX2_9MYRT|nr:hypothetical protein MLD38_000205 [Melastoma candidum]
MAGLRNSHGKRYLYPSKKIGSIIGRGGEIVKQLRLDTRAKIRIEEVVPGAEERCWFKIHKRVVPDKSHEDDSEAQSVTARLLVPSDQIGCFIGKGGRIVQNIRNETGANIRILKDNHFPAWAIESDELVRIYGEAAMVKKAISEITGSP